MRGFGTALAITITFCVSKIYRINRKIYISNCEAIYRVYRKINISTVDMPCGYGCFTKLKNNKKRTTHHRYALLLLLYNRHEVPRNFAFCILHLYNQRVSVPKLLTPHSFVSRETRIFYTCSTTYIMV